MEDLDPLTIVRDLFDQAAGQLTGLKTGLIDFFKAAKRNIMVCFPVEMDDGYDSYYPNIHRHEIAEQTKSKLEAIAGLERSRERRFRVYSFAGR